MSDVNVKENKIDEIERKISQLKAKKQSILQRDKQKERKARTKRLIEMGAVLEANLLINSPKDTKLLCDALKQSQKTYDFVKTYISDHAGDPDEESEDIKLNQIALDRLENMDKSKLVSHKDVKDSLMG